MAVMQEEQNEETAERAERRPKRNDRWVCPKCGEGITLHVKPTFPPSCNSSKHSTTGAIVMELKSSKK